MSNVKLGVKQAGTVKTMCEAARRLREEFKGKEPLSKIHTSYVECLLLEIGETLRLKKPDEFVKVVREALVTMLMVGKTQKEEK